MPDAHSIFSAYLLSTHSQFSLLSQFELVVTPLGSVVIEDAQLFEAEVSYVVAKGGAVFLHIRLRIDFATCTIITKQHICKGLAKNEVVRHASVYASKIRTIYHKMQNVLTPNAE